MKRFKFNLEAVLLLREREEREAAAAWAKALHAQNIAESALADAQAELTQCEKVLSEKRQGSFLPGEQQIFLYAYDNQKAICQALARRVQEAIEFTKKQHAILLQARMKLEVLQRLKEKKRHDYDLEMNAWEEAAIQDMVIAGYGSRRSEG